MKSYKFILDKNVVSIIVCIFLLNSSVQAAKFDSMSSQPNEELKAIFDVTPELFDYTEWSENHRKKNKKIYDEVINYLKQNELEKADNKIQVFLSQNEDSSAFYNLKGVLEFLRGNTAKAKDNYQKSIKLDPNNISSYLGLAQLALKENQLGKAGEYAKKVNDIDEHNENAYLILAGLAHKKGDEQAVENLLISAYLKNQGDLNSKIAIATKLGSFYVAQKKPEKFLALSQELVDQYPSASAALSFLAGAEIVNGKKDSAIKTLLKIISSEKQDVKHRIILAKLLGESSENEQKVINLFDEIIEIKPSEQQTFVFKTAYLIALKRFQRAMDVTHQVEKLFPTSALGKQLKGDVFLAQKKNKQALEAYRQAYQLTPTDKVLYLITDLMGLQGDQIAAIALLESELSKNTKNKAIQFKLASIYQQQKDYQKAIQYFNDILKEQPENALVLNNMAWIYARENDPKALVYAEKAYKKSPNSAAIVDTYGYILIKQGGIEKGLALLENAAFMAPEENSVQFHLADGYSRNGKLDKAINILEKLEKSAQNFPEKDAAVNLLRKLKAL